MKRSLILTLFIGFIWALIWADAEAQKITAEDIIAKNLESIGKRDDRARLKNITLAGEVAFAKLGSSTGPATGKVVLASEGEKSLFAMSFPNSVYQGEKFVFDGKTSFVGFSQPGLRSGLGDFLFQYERLIKDGLLAGVLNTGWTLGDVSGRNVRVSFDGTKKIDERETYVINYEPRKGSDVKIKLYFDKDTYRHLRTEYQRTNAAGMGSNPNTSSRLSETHESLTEDFSDFRTENGLTLPRTYKLRLYLERRNGTYESTYTITLTDLYYNSQLDPVTFETK